MRDSRGRRTTLQEALQERQQQRQQGSGTVEPAARRANDGFTDTVRMPWRVTEGLTVTIGNTTTDRQNRFFTTIEPIRNLHRDIDFGLPNTTVNIREEILRHPVNINRDLTWGERFETTITNIPNRPARASARQGSARRNATRRMAKTKLNYLTVMVSSKNYKGLTYSYSVDKVHGVGRWKVKDICVAELDLTTISLMKIILPVGSNTLLNHARFLWRLIGLKAVRYKDKTVVMVPETENGAVLKQGEVWNPGIPILSYIKQPFLESKQEELFDADSQLRPLTLYSDEWVNYLGENISFKVDFTKRLSKDT